MVWSDHCGAPLCSCRTEFSKYPFFPLLGSICFWKYTHSCLFYYIFLPTSSIFSFRFRGKRDKIKWRNLPIYKIKFDQKYKKMHLFLHFEILTPQPQTESSSNVKIHSWRREVFQIPGGKKVHLLFFYFLCFSFQPSSFYQVNGYIKKRLFPVQHTSKKYTKVHKNAWTKENLFSVLTKAL